MMNIVNHLVYSLYNHTVTTGDTISTGYKPQKAGVATTILFDMTTTANPTSGTASKWKLFICYNSTILGWGLCIGKKGTGNSSITAWWMAVETNMPTAATSVGRQRLAILHEADSDDLIVKYKKDNGTLQTFTLTQAFVTADNLLYFGNNSNNYELPAGIINKAEIYDIVLDATDISEFFT